MSEAREMPDDYGEEREPTRHTACRYCGKLYPLRDISRHARVAHNEESTRYTDCRICGGRFPLREIRAHARGCQGKAMIESLPLITKPQFEKNMLNDTFSVSFDGGAFQEQIRRALIEADDNLAEPVIIEWLRSRGYSVEKLDGPRSVFCPNCQARPGQPCSTPTDTGRRDVRSDWFHYARRDAANA